MDSHFSEMFIEFLEKHCMWLEYGEGDPTDLYITMQVD